VHRKPLIFSIENATLRAVVFLFNSGTVFSECCFLSCRLRCQELLNRFFMEQTTLPQPPEDSLSDRIKDFFASRYGSSLSSDDAELLSDLLAQLLEGEHLISQSAYQTAARKCLGVLMEIDREMSQTKNPGRQWLAIALALGLPSVCASNLSQSELARRHNVSKMSICYQTRKFRESLDLPAAFTTGWRPSLRSLIKQN
jgi:hypothetical protein